MGREKRIARAGNGWKMEIIDDANAGLIQVGFWYSVNKLLCSGREVKRMSDLILAEFDKIKDDEGFEVVKGPDIIFHSDAMSKHRTLEERGETTIGIKATVRAEESSIKLTEGVVPKRRGWIKL